MKKTVLALLLALGIIFSAAGQTAGPMDLVVLLDTSASMSDSYQQTSDYLIGPFLKEFLRIGDTFHLISFSRSPKLEISRKVEGVGDVETIIGRLLLMYPLDPDSDISRALSFTEKYAASLPGNRYRKVVLLTDGDGGSAAVQTAITESSARLKGQNSDFQYIKVPITGSPPVSGRPKAVAQSVSPARTPQTPASQPAAQKPVQPAAQTQQPPAQTSTQPSQQAQQAPVQQTPSPAAQPARTQTPSQPAAQTPAQTQTPSQPAAQTPAQTQTPNQPAAQTPAQTQTPNQPAAPAQTSTQPSQQAQQAPDQQTPFDQTPSQEPAAQPGLQASPLIEGSADNTQTQPAQPAQTAAPNQAAPAPAQAAKLAQTQSTQAARSSDSGALPLPLIIGLIILALIILALIIFLISRNLHSSPNRVMAQASSPTILTAAPPEDNREMMSRYAEKQKSAGGPPLVSPPPKHKTLPKDKPIDQNLDFENGPPLLSLFVEDQNTAIGRRNIHAVKSGYSFTVGGGKSDFLVFLVPIPPHIADVNFDGRTCTFIPRKPQYFPDIGSQQVSNCIGKTIRVISDKNYELLIRIERYEDPLTALNNLLHSINVPGR